MGAAPLALAQTAQAQTPPANGQEEITVTATRVATNIQKTSVQVTAFSGAKLQDRVVNQLNDITYIAPSVQFTSNTSSSSSYITIRGIGDPDGVGSAAPSSQAYFENVPQGGAGLFSSINFPTFDLANVQVLQGPQGTLFGRTAIGGAILIDPVLPSYEQDGYLKASYGNYNAWVLEGAANAIIIPDVLALRVAGQVSRRDGYIHNIGAGFNTPLGNIDQDSLRASLLFTPTASFKNVTTFVYFNAPETGVPTVLQDPAFTNFIFGGVLGSAAVNKLIACNHLCIDEGLAPQSDFFFNRTNYQVYNTTTWQLNPNLILKNIFGYQQNRASVGQDTFAIPFSPFISQAYETTTVLTEDAQAIFNVFDNRVHGLAGVYYESDGNSGPNGDSVAGNGITNASWHTTVAVYWDLTLNITDKLALNGGFRDQWDRSTQCSEFFAGQLLPGTGARCLSDAASGTGGAFATPPFNASATAWKVGLSYQATPDVYLYATASQATREASLNSLGPATPCTDGTGVAVSSLTPPAGECVDLGWAINGMPSGHPINIQGMRLNVPDTVTEEDIGIRSTWHFWGWNQRLNLTYFHYYHANALASSGLILGPPGGAGAQFDTLGDPGNPTSYNVLACNCSNVTANGVDVDLALLPTRDLSLDFNLAYLNQAATRIVPPPFGPGSGLSAAQLVAAENSGNFPGLTSPTAPLSYTIAARYVLPWRPLRGDLVLNYNYFWTAGWSAQGVLEPGYDIHNLRLDWNNIGNSHVSLGVWVRNLLDDRYVQAAVDAPVETVTYGEPRMFGVDATYKFH